MKKQFCDYDISLRLRNLGFDEPCFKIYKDEDYLEDFYILDHRNRPVYSSFEATTNTAVDDEFVTWSVPEEYDSVWCTAPLFQQAIDWFREKHKLLIDSPKLDEWNYGKWSVKITSLNKSIILEEYVGQPYWRIYRCFNSYEEAREQSIIKAIEILEENDML